MTSIVLRSEAGVTRDEVMRGLKERRIDSRPFFPPMSSFPMWASRAAENPNAYRIARQGINLPSGHNLTEEDVERVCVALEELLLPAQHRASHTCGQAA
jgi:perosamine synthetase